MTPARYLQELQDPPLPLTPVQRKLFWVTAVLVALSRLAAISRSMWDWDEALFALGMRDYDVVQHHPHPPGYPLHIAAGRVLRVLFRDDFRSLQAVVVIASIFLLPALFALARELRMSYPVALGGAVLYSFFPNVWYYGGTAFTDVPSTALVAFASALLLRGCRSRRYYFWGAFVLGVAVAFRPQSLLIGFAPAIIATWFRARQRFVDLIGATLIGAGVIVASYGGAALASHSVETYIDIVKGQQQYVREVDSYQNIYRPKLRDLAKDFFVFGTGGGRRTSLALAFLAALGGLLAIVLRRWPTLMIAAMFGPFAIFAWLMLDFYTFRRYAVGYVPIHAFLAADALFVMAGLAGRVHPRGQLVAFVVGVAGIAAKLGIWTVPALAEVRRTDSPPVAAMKWVLANVPQGDSRLVVAGGLGPFTAYFLEGKYHIAYIDDSSQLPPGPYGPHDYLVGDGETLKEEATTFIRPKEQLFGIVRQRYFDCYAVPVTDEATFGEGWHLAEGGDGASWRWMGRRSETELSALRGKGRLSLDLYVPLDGLAQPPTITIRMNGAIIESFVPAGSDVAKTWVVDALADRRNVLTLETSDAVNPAARGTGGDSRDLGLRLDGIGWSPVEE